jgi:hypothetical protein
LHFVRHTARPSEDRLAFEPLILPSSIRLLRPDEVPVHDDRDKILAKVSAGHRARFVAGYVLSDTGRPGFTAYAEVNVHAPAVWHLFRDLVATLLPEYAALLIGVKDEELHHRPYRYKAALLTALEPYGGALARDGLVQCGLIWQRGGTTEEVLVEPAKYMKIWTNQPHVLKQILTEHGLSQAERLAFLDEFPRVTEPVSHPPEMYRYDELIERILRAEGDVPEATPPPAGA